MNGSVTLVRADLESVYVHGAFAKYCRDLGIRVSPWVFCLKEMNCYAERHFVIFMNVTCALLKTSGLPENIFL